MNVKATLQELIAEARGIWTLDACGVTRSETPIPAVLHQDAYAPSTSRARVLLVGGLSGRPEDAQQAIRALEAYLDAAGPSDRVALSGVPCVNMDGLRLAAAPGNGAGGNPGAGYPPEGNFYNDARNPEARYLWRWTCFQAPDLVLEVRQGSAVAWEASAALAAMVSALGATPIRDGDSFLAALGSGHPCGLGPIPGLRLTAPSEALAGELGRLWGLLSGARGVAPSPARAALARRRARAPLDMARLLARTYGQKLDSPLNYTQGVALSGRLRLAVLEGAPGQHVPDVARIVEPYVSGLQPMFGDRAGTANLAGVLWADELYDATGDRRHADLLIGVAERYQPAGPGAAPPPSDPDFRTEDMFMGGALLGRAFRLTGERRYVDLQARFLLDAGVQQPGGLFWHSRSTPFYWGRGNGFAALGFAETLTHLPHGHPDRDPLIVKHLRHLDALRALQHPSGAWLQVLDVPGSYQEFTATCMVGYALARGLRLGWLDASWRPMLERAWQVVCERVSDEGQVADACASTGVQRSLRDYLDRPAILGLDDRSGSMAIWFATEMERLRREKG